MLHSWLIHHSLEAIISVRYDRSRQLYERALRVIPGGVNSNVRAVWDPHPMFYERGKDSHVWDVDGNESIDTSSDGDRSSMAIRRSPSSRPSSANSTWE